MLTKNHRMEGLGLSYVEAVAANVGLNISYSRWDYGIDLTLNSVFRFPNGRHLSVEPRLEVQLKCTTNATLLPDFVRIDLTSKAYNDLSHPHLNQTAILVVLVLPREESDWLTHTSIGLTINGCAYWQSFRDKPAIKNSRSRRILIPRGNVFSPVVLRQMFQNLKKERE